MYSKYRPRRTPLSLPVPQRRGGSQKNVQVCLLRFMVTREHWHAHSGPTKLGFVDAATEQGVLAIAPREGLVANATVRVQGQVLQSNDQMSVVPRHDTAKFRRPTNTKLQQSHPCP